MFISNQNFYPDNSLVVPTKLTKKSCADHWVITCTGHWWSNAPSIDI